MVTIINNILKQPDIVLMYSFCGDQEEPNDFTFDYKGSKHDYHPIPELVSLYNEDIIDNNSFNDDIANIELELFPNKQRYELTKNDVLKCWKIYVSSPNGKLNVTKTCSFIRNYLKQLLIKYKDKLSYENCIILLNKCKTILNTIQSNKEKYNVSFIKMWRLNRIYAEFQNMLKYRFYYKPELGYKIKSFYQELIDIVSKT